VLDSSRNYTHKPENATTKVINLHGTEIIEAKKKFPLSTTYRSPPENSVVPQNLPIKIICHHKLEVLGCCKTNSW
jgi:hypothetical protein